MVTLRRFGPVMALVVLGSLAIVARLFQVQVLQHEVWAREAANLGRTWTVVPYRRGTIFDRAGRVVAQDEEVHELHFVWRDFRRGHPLGQVAEMRSLLEMRPVPLEEALAHLEEWAFELAYLSPAAIDGFGRGEAVQTKTLRVPATGAADEDQRWTRSGHLHFYVQGLLALDRRARRAIPREQDQPGWKLPYAELAALAQARSVEAVLDELVARLRTSVASLGALADLLREEDFEDLGYGTPLERLVQRIELARRDVEDSAADDLFRAAAGFGAWRLDEANLARIDLDWLRRCVYWDVERLADWKRSRGQLFAQAVEDYLAGHVVARFKVETGQRPEVRVLDAFAGYFRAPTARAGLFRPLPEDWRDIDELVVVSELGDLFEGVRLPEAFDPHAVLPFQDPRLRSAELDGLTLLSRALSDVEPALAGLAGRKPPRTMSELAWALLDCAENVGSPTWGVRDQELAALVLDAWHRRLQAALAGVLQSFHDQVAREAGLPRPLRFTAERRKAAREERDYVVRDRGARAARLGAEPRHELIRLVDRYPERYPGFAVHGTTRRLRLELDDEEPPLPLAEDLVGSVRSPFLVQLLEESEQRAQLESLRTKARRSQEERERLAELVGRSTFVGETRGARGIEGYFDALLRGRNGYRETQGLADRAEAPRSPYYRAPRDGRDVVLTLDMELQRAAQRVLEHPEPAPPGETYPDDVWARYPVGAIVLVRPNGDVLAAASVPTRPGPGGAHQDGQREVLFERTLRQPLVHPPGSVFKPFVAAWALQYGGLSPHAGLVVCTPEPGEVLARWGVVRCHLKYGHSPLPFLPPIDLVQALRRSCNVYFSFLGERYFDGERMRAMARAFGFGEPTGVRSLPPELAGLGLAEDARFRGVLAEEGTPLSDSIKQWLGNGLSHISVTPMQVARAYAALATGELPSLRLVQGLDGLQLPREARRLSIDERHLALVRSALVEVVASPGGTAHGKGLGREDLGFTLAAKTGSGDYRPGLVPDRPLDRHRPEWVPGMRKHTWVAGWFPADEPKAIVVVYVHDTSTTASHGATYLTAQFLRSDAVRRFVEETP